MIDTQQLFCYCSLPTIPAELITEIIDTADYALEHGKNIQFSPFLQRLTTNEVSDITIKRLTSSGRKIVRYRRTFLSDNVIKWINENITDKYSEVGIQTMDQGEIMIPHTDGGKRLYILNYLIETGGNNVVTQWHCESGQSVIRNTQRALQYLDESKLETIHEECMLPNSWSMLYGKVIHSVSNITGRRLNISMAMSVEEFLNFKEKHNIDMPAHL